MFLGIDIGTSKIAAVIVTAEGQVLADCSQEHNAALPVAASRAEQDVAILIETVWSVVRRLSSRFRSQVKAIGVTGQMHGVTIIGERGQILTPLITWQDQRCLEEETFLEDLNRDVGYTLSSGFGCATLAWLQHYGLMPTGAAAASTIHDLVTARLCGQSRSLTDPTDAASWGLFDLRNLSWNVEAVSKAKIPLKLLPEVRPCGSLAGHVHSTIADSLGVPVGIPVAVALGDNQASLLATLRHPENELALTLGTGAQLSAVLSKQTAFQWEGHSPAFEIRPYPGQRLLFVGASLCGGEAWAWLVRSLQSWMNDLGLKCPESDELFAKINELGFVASNGLRVKPHFAGERYNTKLRGSIEGIDRFNFGLGQLARGLAKGILINLKDMLPSEIFDGRSRVMGSGNALRQNPLLQRVTEEVLGLPLVLTESRDEAAIGAALNALHLA